MSNSSEDLYVAEYQQKCGEYGNSWHVDKLSNSVDTNISRIEKGFDHNPWVIVGYSKTAEGCDEIIDRLRDKWSDQTQN